MSAGKSSSITTPPRTPSSRAHLALFEVARNAAHRELQPGLAGAAHSLLGGLALAAPGHGCEMINQGGLGEGACCGIAPIALQYKSELHMCFCLMAAPATGL